MFESWLYGYQLSKEHYTEKYVTSLKSLIKINFILFYDIFLSMDQFNSHQDAFMEITNSAVL